MSQVPVRVPSVYRLLYKMSDEALASTAGPDYIAKNVKRLGNLNLRNYTGE